jgi:hypothetical protein
MPHIRRIGCTTAAIATAVFISGSASGGQRESSSAQEQRESVDKKPSLSLKLTPPIGFSPLRVHAVAELKGGPNDYADFYCPSVEWDWGDGTVSENSEDCNPYEGGKSEIRRRFTADHTFRQSDGYRVSFRLKKKARVVASSTVNVQVRPGLRDGAE